MQISYVRRLTRFLPFASVSITASRQRGRTTPSIGTVSLSGRCWRREAACRFTTPSASSGPPHAPSRGPSAALPRPLSHPQRTLTIATARPLPCFPCASHWRCALGHDRVPAGKREGTQRLSPRVWRRPSPLYPLPLSQRVGPLKADYGLARGNAPIT